MITNHRSGFTLLEVTIALAVVAIGLVAIIGLGIGNVATGQAANDKLFATSLAREAVEVVKQIRDSNWLAGRPFADGIIDGSHDYDGAPHLAVVSGEPHWSFNPSVDSFDSPDAVVGWSELEGRYVNGGGTPTKFSRVVETEPLCGSGEGTSFTFAPSGYSYDPANPCGPDTFVGVRVTATVRWRRGLGSSQVAIQTDLFNWK